MCTSCFHSRVLHNGNIILYSAGALCFKIERIHITVPITIYYFKKPTLFLINLFKLYVNKHLFTFVLFILNEVN
jgi:hypothetical protein